MASDITPQAIGFLSTVGLVILLLTVFLLFINKKLCFSRVGGLACLEQRGSRKKHPGLVGPEEDGGSSSSDSDSEVLKHFEISRSRSLRARAQSRRSRLGLSPSVQQDQETVGEDMDASQQQQDALSQGEGTSSVDRSASLRLPGSTESYSLSVLQQAPESNEGAEGADVDVTDADSVSTWTNEQENPPQDDDSSQRDAASSPAGMSSCGELLLSLDYRPHAEKLAVTTIAAQDVPDKARSGMDAWQVHLVLLPYKKQRKKTAVQKGSLPHFNETFSFSGLHPSELHKMAVRFRLYALGGGRRVLRDRMIGEKVLRLDQLQPEGGTTEMTLTLEPRSNLKTLTPQQSSSPVRPSSSASSTQSLAHGGVPELLLGLSYNATTGRLSVEVIKGSHLRNLASSRAPDTFARLSLLNSVGQETSRCKTSVRRGQPNPIYKETFVFQVALFQLSDVTLLLSVYNRRSMKRKEMVGWVALGQNSSGEEERLHWQDMRETGGQQVSRWHVLLEA